MLPVFTITLLLTGCVAPWNVIQLPMFLHVHEQMPLNLQCAFDRRSPQPTAVTFSWFWNNVSVYGFTSNQGTEESNITELEDPRVSLETDWEGASNLTIRNSVPEDTGLYVCLVTIHSPLPITIGRGPGTMVYVLKNPEKGTTPSLQPNFTDPSMTFPTAYRTKDPSPRCCYLSVPLCIVLFPLFLVIILSMYGASLMYLKIGPPGQN